MSRLITSTAPMTKISPVKPGLEECIAFAEGDFRLIDLDDSL